MGRPSSYTDAIAQEICDRLSEGESLRDICADEHMPARISVYRWLRREDAVGEKFRAHYALAREAQADTMIDDCQAIADDGSNDWMEKRNAEGENIGWQLNGEHVARSKLRIEQRRWHAGKLRPKKYGEATLLKHADADGNSLDLAARMAAARARTEGH